MERGVYKLFKMATKWRVNAARDGCAESSMASCKSLNLLVIGLCRGIFTAARNVLPDRDVINLMSVSLVAKWVVAKFSDEDRVDLIFLATGTQVIFTH